MAPAQGQCLQQLGAIIFAAALDFGVRSPDLTAPVDEGRNGSALGIQGAFINLVALAAVNTLLAGAAGGMSSMVYMWVFSKAKKPDPGMAVNGLLAGLVAITSPCAFVDGWAAVIIGTVAGVLVCFATVWLEKAKIDDPVGAVPVHFVNGMWGVLAVGLFAKGNPDTAAWNGIDKPVTGLFYGGGVGQLLAQLLEAASIGVMAFVLSYAFFSLLKRAGVLRSRAEDEIAGLDIPDMGVQGYVGDDGVVMPELTPSKQVGTEAAPAGLPAGAM
jgi:Amt family ammonium transporter